MQLIKAWRVARLVVALALILAAVVPNAATAQNPVVSSQIHGELNERFAKHYLGLQVIDSTQAVTVRMEYAPQDSQDLDAKSGFYVFKPSGLASYNRGASPGASRFGVGSLETTEDGRKQKVSTISMADIINMADSMFSLVTFNDTGIPLAYTLIGENVRFVDESGEQVMDANTPTPTPTPAPAIPALEEIPTPEPEATPAGRGSPRAVRASELSGELPKQFDQHYFALEAAGADVVLKLSVRPPGNLDIQEDVNAFILTEQQLRDFASGMSPDLYANNTARSQVPDGSVGLTKEAHITTASIGARFAVVVSNHSAFAASYTVEVEGGILEDDSGQSQTSREQQPSSDTSQEQRPSTDIPSTDIVTPAPTGTAITPGASYIVERGDTLGTIASRAFGRSIYWSAICAANPQLANCDRIEVGDVLTIPTKAQADALLAGSGTPAPTAEPILEVMPEPTAEAMPEPTAEAMPESTAEAMPEPTDEATPSTGNLIEVTETLEALEILLLALELANLSDSVANGGPFTIFAPTDAAFASVPGTTLDMLMADANLLAQVLQFHVVPGRLTAADLAAESSLETLHGGTIAINTSPDGSSLTVEGVLIVRSDIMATNGVIHQISQLLLPPAN